MAEDTPQQPDDQQTPEPADAQESPTDSVDAADASPDAAAALEGVEAALGQLSAASGAGESAAVSSDDGIAMLGDVSLRVKIELGRTRMYIEDVLKLNEYSIIELDRAAGDPVDIYVNDRYIARGEVLVVNDNFCVRVSELVDGEASVGSQATE